MKRFFYIILSALVLGFAGCSQYALQEDLEALQQEVAELKTLCEQLNGDVESLNKFMEAYNGCKMVTHVVETSYGWTIYFNDETYCDLRHGNDGVEGAVGDKGDKGDKGDSPVIGVAQDTDGIWYWTLDGEFLLVDGNKIPTTGKDALTPTFQVAQNNVLQVSYDGGKTWADVGEIKGVSTVPSAVTDVIVTDTDVTFVLAEGEPLVMARYNSLKVSVSTPVAADGIYTASYTLVGAGENVQVVCSPNAGWDASLSRKDAVSGTITLTPPAVWSDASVLVFAYSDEQIAMTVISITQDVVVVEQNEYTVPAAGTSFNLPVSANFAPVVSATENWVSVVEVKAMTEYQYTITVAENTEEVERSAAINFLKTEGGDLIASIAVKQSAPASNVPVSLSISADLTGSVWSETTLKSITLSSEEALNAAGDKTLDATSGSVDVLPVSEVKLQFTLANGQGFVYSSSLPQDGNITLSGLDALVASDKIVPSYFNLAGEQGTARANCYIVMDGGYYKIPADYLNDGTTAIDVASADWLWSEGTESLISGVSYADGYIGFCVQAGSKGNAVVASKSADGKISWSWHIWMIQDDPTASVHYARSVTNYPIMNYHLGATSASADIGANGLYYQWGRKDPFPRANTMASSSADAETGQFADYTLGYVVNEDVFGSLSFSKTANGTPKENNLTDITYAVQNPMSFVSATSDSEVPTEGIKAVRTWLSTTELADAYKLWNNSHDGTNQDLNAIKSTDKTNYDPCPAGYIVPSSARMVWHNGSSWKYDNLKFQLPYNVCFMFTNDTDGTSAYYPASGFRTDGKLQKLSIVGSTWASYLTFNSSNSRLMGQMMRVETPTFDDKGAVTEMKYVGSGTFQSSSALPVRCCRIVDSQENQ